MPDAPKLPVSSVTSQTVPAVANQSRSRAGRDLIGRDKIDSVTINNYTTVSAGNLFNQYPTSMTIETLLAKLQAEMDANQQTQDTIAKLQRFQKRRQHDAVIGLEAKLTAAKRDYEYIDAIEMKELFSKLLERFSLFASAQEILALLLARIEYNFTHFIYPEINNLSIVEMNYLIDLRIIEPTVRECGPSLFGIDHSIAMGMIYWLADQCFVRWHR